MGYVAHFYKGNKIMQPKDTSKGHFWISIVKSIVRIGAGFSLVAGGLVLAGTLFIVAELLGILEELV